MKALNKKMWRDLWNLRGQTVTTAVLIICGVSLLVATWSAYRSLQEARDTYYKKAFFADAFAEFKSASLNTILKIEAVAGVQLVEGRILTEGLINLPGNIEPAVGRFISIPSGSQPRLNQIHLRSGRLPMDGNNFEVIAYQGFADAHHLRPGDKINVTIQGQSEVAHIVGIGLSPEFIYALSPSAPLPDDLHFGIFWATESSLQRIHKLQNAYNSILVKMHSNASKPFVISQIDRILKPSGSLGAYTRDRQISNMFVEDEIAEQKVTAIFIPVIFLGIAAFLIHIIASRLMTLHRPQIAALKALGYNRWEITTHYLKLILTMSLVGTIPGIVLGAFLGQWMSNLYESFFRFPQLQFSISMNSTIIGLISGVFPGLIGAFGSLQQIFKLEPAEAMRPIAPPAFHKTFFDRLHLRRWLSVIQIMVFRNLFLRPWRLPFTVLSLSAALAIVILAGSWNDMIKYLLQVQFQRSQREDISLQLLHPKGTNVLQELSRMPGVVQVEGYRVVPVRIKYLNHKRELSLVGWPATGKMHQLLTPDLQVIRLPEDGILLSRFFEKEWGVKAGDFIDITPLEGAQKLISVPVSGFTDDLVGLNINSKIENLWRWLGELPAYNQIIMQSDPQKIRQLYVQLKSHPQISSVNLKQSLYKGFQETFGKIIRSTTQIIMVASVLIAVGIIYNSVRVSFSERSKELASLRVLGFDRLSIFTVLLFEMGIQILLSILPGCFLGWGLTHLSMALIHTETFRFPVIIDRSTYARGIFSILIAFMGSSWVAYRMVGKLNPAEALKERE